MQLNRPLIGQIAVDFGAGQISRVQGTYATVHAFNHGITRPLSAGLLFDLLVSHHVYY